MLNLLVRALTLFTREANANASASAAKCWQMDFHFLCQCRSLCLCLRYCSSHVCSFMFAARLRTVVNHPFNSFI